MSLITYETPEGTAACPEVSRRSECRNLAEMLGKIQIPPRPGDPGSRVWDAEVDLKRQPATHRCAHARTHTRRATDTQAPGVERQGVLPQQGDRG